ncbi:uncharacterized protein LOC132306048 [Cornus florida]|uniref:uncharacterized protein LOC132306048 n=1 Tax=Cornus florida TaxID=4283 RepID=UPI0028A06E97|nr:uncharacterized protein LOC132306048 [Cornus florida]
MAMFKIYKNIPLIHIYVSKPNEEDNEAVRSVEEEVDTDNDSIFSVKNQNADSNGNAENQNVENENANSDGNVENQNAENDEFGNIEVDDEELDDVSLYDIRFKKNERKRVTAICVNGCGWRIHASLRGNGNFELSTIKPNDPDCPEAEINRQATSTYIAKKFKVMRAKRKSLEIIEGHHEDQFSKIREYFALVMKINPGSVCKVKTKLEPDRMSTRLERVFFSLNTMWRGFMEGCGHFIGLDGCFLKTPYNQILLSVIGRDGDSSFYPIALVVVEAETKDSWDWLIKELMAVISPYKAITWISDRQKGLVDTLASLDGGQDYRFCVRHLHENFKKKYLSMKLKQMVWNAANAFNKPEFKKYMQSIRELNGEAYDWLCKIPFRFWTKSKFTDSSKCYLNSNNMCELWNSHILKERDKPIIS